MTVLGKLIRILLSRLFASPLFTGAVRAFWGCSLCLCLIPPGGCSPKPIHESITSWRGATMGTTYTIKIVAPPLGQSEIHGVSKIIRDNLTRVNVQMNHYASDSEISRFNRDESGRDFSVSEDFFRVLQMSLKMNSATNGAFDISVGRAVSFWGFGPPDTPFSGVPSKNPAASPPLPDRDYPIELGENHIVRKSNPDTRIDLSAIAKGYAVDLLAARLRESGFRNFMIEIGGEVYCAGINLDHKPWRIAVDRPEYNPSAKRRAQVILSLSDAALATSGDYRNFRLENGRFISHIIDPKTGRPASSDLAGVSVIAPSCAIADAAATALFVMGPQGARSWIDAQTGMECLLLIRMGDDFVEWKSAGLDRYLVRE